MDYPPLQYVDEGGVPHGLDIEFTKRLMSRLNVPFTYSTNSWENISEDVLKGRVDLAMMVYSPYRKDLTNYSRGVFRLYYQLVYRKNEKAPYGLRDLSGKEIAHMASKPINDTLVNVGAKPILIMDLSKALHELSEGKYDAVICFRYQAKYLIDKFHFKNLVIEDLTLTPREYCYVSHDKALIDSINTVLEKMQAEGVVDEVYAGVTASFDGIKIPQWFYPAVILLVIGVLLTFIVFQQRYQKKLRQEMHRAQRSEQLKTVILSNISHALRTPLNAIIGFSDVLSADDGSMAVEDRQQLLQLVNSNGQQLLHFINQLLDLSDIQASNSPLELVEVAIADEAKAYIDECRGSVSEGVDLRVEGDDVKVMVDGRYLRIVTKHFLSNAIRHTKQGSVTLRYRLQDKGLYVEVQDTGDGLPEALRENLFSLLSDKATFVQNEVPGLGLTICKAIVDRCKGKIGAQSPADGGTIVWFWMPVKEVKEVKEVKSEK
jgi:signal transduction histidine kinase